MNNFDITEDVLKKKLIDKTREIYAPDFFIVKIIKFVLRLPYRVVRKMFRIFFSRFIKNELDIRKSCKEFVKLQKNNIPDDDVFFTNNEIQITAPKNPVSNRKFRIAFDASGILGFLGKGRGIEKYCTDFFKTMIMEHPEHEYYFFNLFDSSFMLRDILTKGTCVNETSYYVGNGYFLMRDIRYRELVGNIVKNYIQENNIDVFYCSSPFEEHNVLYDRKWFGNCKLIYIVYDIIPYVFKECYLLNNRAVYDWYMKAIENLRKADQIQVISKSTKDDMVNLLNFDESKIKVIWAGINEKFRKLQLTENCKIELFDKYGIRGPFIINVGGGDARKNISSLIEAYARMPKEIIEKYQLVLVCNLADEYMETYSNLIKLYGVERNVIFTRFVPDDELVALYNAAKLFAFPSLYEGFGLPIVEAWACEVPVLTSNNSSSGQIAGKAAIVVNPFDVDSISQGLRYALTECDLASLVEKGKERLKVFDWKHVVNHSISAIYEIVSPVTNIKCDETDNHKKRIAFFTPLPPIKSGISDYSVDILNVLCKYYDIDVYIDEGYETNVNFPSNVKVLCHDIFRDKAHEYFDVVYQVGNSEFHFYMWNYIQQFPGTVVLHDYNLHAALYWYCFKTTNFGYDLYSKYLKHDFDKQYIDSYIRNLKKARTYVWINTIEINGFLTDYAKKIIVHSANSKRKLLQKDISRHIKKVYHYANAVCADYDSFALKEKFGYKKDEFVFASFGNIFEAKRSFQILKAFSDIYRKNENIRLVFVGLLDKNLEERFMQTIKNHELQSVVSMTGYVEMEEFENYIKMCDVCLNLRYPYNGETSGVLMRSLAYGKTVIVNDVGSFGEIPDDSCIKLPDVASLSENEERFLIGQVMNRCIEDKEFCERVGKNARRFAVEKLSLEKVVCDYRDFLEDANKCSLTEDLLPHIAKSCCDSNMTEHDVMRFSKTMAYAKEGHCK